MASCSVASTLFTAVATTFLILAQSTSAVRIVRPSDLQRIGNGENVDIDVHLTKRLTGNAKTGIALGVVCGVFAVVALIVAYTGIVYNRRKKAKAKARQAELEEGIPMGGDRPIVDQLPPSYQRVVNENIVGTTKGIDPRKVKPSRTG